MPSHTIRNTLLWFLLLSVSHATAETLEVHLHRQAVRSPGIVRLGHVAELQGLTAQRRRRLESLAICPWPHAGGRVVITRDLVRRLLVLEGVPGRSVVFRGAEQIVLQGTNERRSMVRTSRSVAEQVRRAIASRYRETNNVADAAVSLLAGDLPDFLQAYHVVDVEPVVGKGRRSALSDTTGQEYQIVFARNSDHRIFSTSVTARVQQVIRVVVPVRALQKGDIIRPGDVELAPLPDGGTRQPSGRVTRWLRRLDDAVGMEAQQKLTVGQPIRAEAVRPPIVIRRRDAVELVARSGGIAVRTIVMALEDAHKGELVRLEKPDTREKVVARAVGFQQAEIRLSTPGSKKSFFSRRGNP